MRKTIKILALIIFILLVFGITTSQALSVDTGTTADRMIQELEEGGFLTGISNTVRKGNLYLYCRQRGQPISASAKYYKSGSATYPNDDTNNGHAKAYILSASGYDDNTSNGLRQYAWWQILGQEPDKNELLIIAEAYQTYKKSEEKDTIVDHSKATTFNGNGNTLIYGPIIVTYSYASGSSGSYSDEWGGFDYVFVNNNTKITSGVNLCILNNGNYTPITSRENSDDYYEVRTANYNNQELYIVVDLSETGNINQLNIKIKENVVDYKAEVYEIAGEYTTTEQERNYCTTCEDIIDNKRKNLSTNLNVGDIVEYNGEYYQYIGKEENVTESPNSRLQIKDQYSFDGIAVDISASKKDTIIKVVDTRNGQHVSGNWTEESAKDFVDNNGESYEIMYTYKYTSYNYKFKIFAGCGVDGDAEVKTVSTGLEQGDIVLYNEEYYKYTGNTPKTKYIESAEERIYNYYKYGDIYVPTNRNSPVSPNSVKVYNEQGGPVSGIYTIDAAKNYVSNNGGFYIVEYKYTTYNFELISSNCGSIVNANTTQKSQNLFIVKSANKVSSNEIKLDNEIRLTTSIEITKKWEDYSNQYAIRPSDLSLKVYRRTNQTNWTELTKGTDYNITAWTKNGNTWTATINGLRRNDSNGNLYYFKVEEVEPTYYDLVSYSPESISADAQNREITITNKLEHIDFSGYVWLDGQTGIKPAVPHDGIMQSSETKMENITVYLYYKNPTNGTVRKVAETKTDSNGHYQFEDYEIGYYYIKFEYDGVHYEDTISVANGNSKAFETDANRNNFNGKFQTITYKASNAVSTLDYNYANNKSTLITTEENGNIKQEFTMNAASEQKLYTSNVNDINLGLVKRGTDIALSTDLSNAVVDINGQKTNYTFNSAANTIEIGNGQTSDTVSYNLNLYASDYNYRIRDYVSNSEFEENDYINEQVPAGTKTGNELKVFTIYELNLQNQSTETTRINEVKYTFDEKYTFKQITDTSYSATVLGNTITINLNGLSLGEGETKTLYLLFEVNNNEGLTLGNFSNKAEITSYSTDEGLIDVDSQPGNCSSSNQHEDDCDTAGGLTIRLAEDTVRKITGKVFDEESEDVNEVIVQLIELKTVNNKVYEYIWQETVSGSGKGLRLNADGTALEEYTYTKADGTYEFIGVIPGDYIVRFIYGDGTTYDMTGNVIKYNGQDYKSTKDSNYRSEWYNSATYTEGASVARDNEARRLETMAYSVNIDASKGVLLKLLNNLTVDDLNETEKEILVSTYNNLYDPDITEVTTEVIDKLLKEQVLKNTWMCAETSKIKVAVDTESIANTSTTTTVNGINRVYEEEIQNVNLGLELRPATKIELKKYITGFKLVAANGQTLVNAYIDVNEYLNNPTDISNKVQGIRDNVTILDTVWQYEVAPTDINTIVDGASLEFEYTLVVKNTGDTDYLSAELTNAYENSSTADYVALLTSKANEKKGYMRTGTYSTQIGNTLGNSYYVGGTGTNKVKTEVTNIRDYVNNDLTFVFAYEGKVEIDNDENLSHTYRTLRDDYSMQDTQINTILRTTEATGKMSNTDSAKMYVVTLGKNPISATGNLNFENYIAEVMSYTNAAGRRTITSTPGNAEIIDHEHREGKAHEIDEADTARIQVGAATGEDGKTNYIIITAAIIGIAIIAAGAFVVKKYVIK